MKLCDKILKLRKRKGLSQEELANQLDVSRQSVFKWECGESTPDVTKIIKISKLFDVSLDALLDESVSLDDETSSSDEKSEQYLHEEKRYRKVFVSNAKLNCGELADYEHGYGNGRRISNVDHSTLVSNHLKAISEHHYSKTVRIQHDVLVDFFIDEKNKLFGFVFDGAPQFVCPFENYKSNSISKSGPPPMVSRVPTVGIGVGAISSVGIGSTAVHRPRMPLRYDLVITYRDEKKSLCNYKIAFGCNRSYILDNKTVGSPGELIEWENMLSVNTNNHLSEICGYMDAIAKESFSNKNLADVDVVALSKESEAVQWKKRITVSAHLRKVKRHNVRGGVIEISFGVAFIVAGILMITLRDPFDPYLYIGGGTIAFVIALTLIILGIKKIIKT